MLPWPLQGRSLGTNARQIDAIKSAINNYYKKNPNAKATNLGGREAKLESVAA